MASSAITQSKLRTFLEMIKFEHTVFALPFAYIGAILVEQKLPSWPNFIWITLAMIGARTAAMSLNRIIDKKIDAMNPRTAGRAIPKGLLSVSEVWVYVFLSLILLMVSSYQLSALAFHLFPIAVFALVIYPYAKRFTWTCHLILGLSLGLAPLGAWIAISGVFALPGILLALGVMFWVAGFDIIYACDDYEFDVQNGVFSIPARFGIKNSLAISTVFHILAPLLFLLVGWLLNLGLFYYCGVIISVVILIYEHHLVKPDDLSKGGAAFFTMNGMLSILMLIFTLLDRLF